MVTIAVVTSLGFIQNSMDGVCVFLSSFLCILCNSEILFADTDVGGMFCMNFHLFVILYVTIFLL